MLNVLKVFKATYIPVAFDSFNRSLPAKSTNTIFPNFTIMWPSSGSMDSLSKCNVNKLWLLELSMFISWLPTRLRNIPKKQNCEHVSSLSCKVDPGNKTKDHPNPADNGAILQNVVSKVFVPSDPSVKEC